MNITVTNNTMVYYSDINKKMQLLMFFALEENSVDNYLQNNQGFFAIIDNKMKI